MPVEYIVTTPRPTVDATRPVKALGLACAASGVIGIAVGILTLSYPAAVASDRWSYPFGTTAQWVVSIALAVTHLLTLAGFVGTLIVAPYGRSRAAGLGLRIAIAGYVGLAVCEVLSGALGTQGNSTSAANALGTGFGVTSLLTALGSVVAGFVILRRSGRRNADWSMLGISGVLMIVLVTPANISGNLTFEMVALMLWSAAFVPLGLAVARAGQHGSARAGNAIAATPTGPA